MNRSATLLVAAWAFAALWPTTALAQPVRNGDDVLWARDVGAAALTLDGALSEAAWATAESVDLQFGTTFTPPGGGYDDFFTSFPEPNNTDPLEATVRFLRDGNEVWIGISVSDASVGGSVLANGGFFQHDGVVMSITDLRNRPDAYNGPHWFNGGNTDEFFYAWLSNDTTATGLPRPGAMPDYLGNHGDDRALWEGATVVNGTTNDDSGASDTGYTMEIRLDAGMLGFDFDSGDGDRLPMSLAVYDKDYAWPADPARQYLGRAWFQNGWGGDMPYGVAFIHGRPGVDLSSGTSPVVTEPDLRLPGTLGAVTLDGMLDDGVWGAIAPQVSLQYQATVEELDALPGFGPYYTHWFRPGGDPPAPPVVDPSNGRFRFFHRGDMLYVGLDSDDQAISGNAIEDRGDGMRFTIRSRESEDGNPYAFNGFLALIDSTGALVLRAEPDSLALPQAALALKGASTIANPDDIDEGYQIEMAIDLRTIPGYESGLGDRVVWIGATYFDGDYLPEPGQDYGMRTWWLVERGGGPFGGPAAWTYLDPNLLVASEGGPDAIPGAIRLLGGSPNPFDAATTLRYALPEAGTVTVLVYDALGREVARLAPGLQGAGANRVTLDAAGLASGVYVYRVRLDGARGVTMSEAGQVTLLK